LAFILGKPLRGPGVGLLDVLRATEYVVPAIEIVDALAGPTQNLRYRFRQWGGGGDRDRRAARSVRSTPIYAGSAASCIAIPRSRRPALPPACSAIRRSAWRGSPTSSASMA
jgi:hypothetical protein